MPGEARKETEWFVPKAKRETYFQNEERVNFVENCWESKRQMWLLNSAARKSLVTLKKNNCSRGRLFRNIIGF